MVLHLFIGLIVLSFASLLITQGRRRRIWSVGLLAGLAVIIYFFIGKVDQMSAGGFIYQWLPYEMLKADINISASLRTQQLVAPLTGILLGLIYFNTIASDEKHSLHINTLTLLNFVAFILLISSHDFLQLMFADCVVFLIAFYIIDLPQARKIFFIFNFLAEMCIFTAFAITYGQMESVSLSAIGQLTKHTDTVILLLLLAIGSKCGLFLLNGHYLNLKDIAFNRLAGIMLMSVPLTGIVLILKCQSIFIENEWAKDALEKWIYLSVGFSLLSAIINENSKIKTIMISCSFYGGLMLQSVLYDVDNFYVLTPLVLDVIFLTFMIFVLADKGASGEKNVLYLGGFWHYTKLNFLLTLILLLIIADIMTKMLAVNQYILFCLYAAIVVFVKMVYFGESRADEKVRAFASNVNILYWLPLLGVSVFFAWKIGAGQLQLWYKFLGLSLLILLLPSKIVLKSSVMSFDIGTLFIKIYEIILVGPLMLFGRILWLAFDVVVVERNIIGSIGAVTRWTVQGLQHIQSMGWRNFWLGMGIGTVLLIIYMGKYIYE